MREILKHPDCAPGTWWWTKGERAPTISCPGCQGLGQLDHVVEADGKVDPSLACPKEECGFHEKIRLLGWDHGRMDFH